MDRYDIIIKNYASDILDSSRMILEKSFIQHGNTSVFSHSVMVTKMCLKIVDKFKIDVSISSLVRGALLHDYFLYDWHTSSNHFHGFTHGKTAMNNAIKDFNVNEVEKNMILCHMFPLTLRIPKYKESFILCIADKICAIKEFIEFNLFRLKFLCCFSNYACFFILFFIK